jgi:class 3 adenylate cyclase
VSEERRLVTVLFADVSGSTALGEVLDPEDLRALLTRYFAIAREVVAAHGGTVEKFIGDAVMAVFGLPTAHDDDAERAAATALSLRDRVRDDPVLADRLPIRLGLATGEVVATTDEGAGDFLVTGDSINTAARLQQAAGDWEILATVRTARAAGSGFAFGPAIGVEAKGKAVGIEARRLEGRQAPRRQARWPFLGRDADVDQLELTTRRALRERRPFLVTITAVAGIGKTRLLDEYLERLEELEPTARVLITQCVPYGQQLTYLPLQTLLRSLLELADDADLELLEETAGSWLADADDPDPKRTAGLLAATFGAGDGDPIDRAELFSAWRSTIEHAARKRPVVVVVEDLHWSSDSLLDLIEVVLQPRSDVPLMMIVLARPELLDRRPTWGGGRRNYVSIALEPLDDDAIDALVGFLIHDAPPRVVETIVRLSAGNPFFAGELAQTLIDRTMPLDDPAAVESALATLPDTVQATVLARIDLLPPPSRRVLQLGSVFGRSFTPEGVKALGPDDDDPADAIEHLVDHEVIRPDARGDYVYRHILIREVAYGTLPRAERARLHAVAGAWLEQRSGGREEEVAELVAFHFREAIKLGGTTVAQPDPELVDRAVTWLRRAADAAGAGAAYEERGRHFLAAIEIAPRDQLPELWVEVGDVFGGGGTSIDAYATAARLGRELGRPADFVLRALSGELTVLGRWAATVSRQPTRDELDALMADVRATRALASDRRAIAYSLVAEAFLPAGFVTGGFVAHSRQTDLEIETARGPAEQAYALATELDDPILQSAALDAIGALDLGVDPRHGLEVVGKRVAIAHRLPLYERSDVYNMLAWTHAALGDLTDVIGAADTILRDLGPNQAQGLSLSLAAWRTFALAMLGRWDEVAPEAERCVRLWEDAGRFSAGYALNGFLAALEVGRARADERLTQRTLAVVLGICEQFPPGHIFRRLEALAEPDPATLVESVVMDWEPYVTRFHLVAQVLAVCVDHRQPIPLDALDRMISEMRRRDQLLLLAQVLRARGVMAGDPDAFREALGLFRGFGSLPMIARVEIEIGSLVGDPNLMSSGLASLERLGDVAQLNRSRAVASST